MEHLSNLGLQSALYLTVRQFVEKHKAFTQGGMRSLIFNEHQNGLAKSGAIIRLGRKILIEERLFLNWVASQNGGGRMIPIPSGLREAMFKKGFTPPDFINDRGSIRFSTNKSRTDTAGSITPLPGGFGYRFHCFRTGISGRWHNNDISSMTLEERAAYEKHLQEAKEAHEEEQESRWEKAMKIAEDYLSNAKTPHPNHGYLIKKGIPADIAQAAGAREDAEGNLVIPIQRFEISLSWSYQLIDPQGNKQFLKGGRTKGGHKFIGGLDLFEAGSEGYPFPPMILLVEGFATGCTIYQATGQIVCICFNAGNLKPVAEFLKFSCPSSQLIICGDDDINTKGNPGRTKAMEAARAVNGKAIFPVFTTQALGTDFNDLAQSEGLEAVRKQLAFIKQSNEITELKPFPIPELHIEVDARDGTINTRPLSELGNALRLLDVHADNIYHVPEVKAWLNWRDGAWHWDIDGAYIRSLGMKLPQQIYNEGNLCLKDAEYFAIWARTSQKNRTIQAAIALLQDFEAIRQPLALIDSNPFMLGFDHAKQVIDLHTGNYQPAKQQDFITKSLGVNQMGDAAKAERWQAFLIEIFAGDVELIDWFQRWCGYLLTGSTAEQFFIFCFGLGANGKSVLADLLRYIMADYARAIAVETLTDSKRSAGNATPDLAELIGARLVVSSETEDGAALAESLVKSLVSGDGMTARKLYCSPIQFTPQFKLMVMGNHKPIIKGNDFGIWRRVRLIPFRRVFEPEERDSYLLDKLKAETPHILAWMVRGCLEWQRRGLKDTPAVIQQATKEYQKDQDIVGNWISEFCVQNPNEETPSNTLYASYKSWCLDNGLRPASSTALGRRLSERGFAKRQSNGKTLWQGLKPVLPIELPGNKPNNGTPWAEMWD